MEVRPATASLVVQYTGHPPNDFHECVAKHGQTSGVYDLPPPPLGEAGELMDVIEREAEFLAGHSALARTIVEDTRKLDVALKKVTDNNLDLKVLVPLGLAVGSFFLVGAEIATPLWVTLGIFSFNSFVSLHPALPYTRTEAPVPAPPEEGRPQN